VLDDQLRSQLRDVRHHEVGEEEVPGTSARLKTTSGPKGTAKKSSGIQSNEVLIDQNKEERRKRRTTEDMLSKAEEDCRLLHKQLKISGSSTASSNVVSVLQQPLVSVSTETPTTSRRPRIASQESTPSMSTGLTSASEVGVQLLQVLREATASSSEGGRFLRDVKLNEEYPDAHTLRTFYRSLKNLGMFYQMNRVRLRSITKSRTRVKKCLLETDFFIPSGEVGL
jgi:hypothetical protein